MTSSETVALGQAGEPEVAPAVVVVMVAHDPGEWWEFTLESIAEQTYPNIATFVVDTAGEHDLTARLAAVLPDAHLRRLDEDPGYGPASNEAITAIEGAAFFLLCHDDVALDSGAVQAMVEEAFRSNAGIVGPKIVEWDANDRLIQAGMGADKFGAPSPFVDRGELDQEQHDGVRDVFFVPGAATLIRADLFTSLGGFDPGIEFLGEDLDLCWRAHIVGARVLVAPAAKVAHKEALDERRDTTDRRRLAYRHRLRTVLICYGRFHRWRVLPQAFLLGFVEALTSLLLGRVRHAGDVVSAWTYNFGNLSDIRSRRKEIRAHRVVPDKEIRPLQVRGSARLTAFFRGQLGANDDRLSGMAGAGRDFAASLRSPTGRVSLYAWLVVITLMVIGSRDLITQPIPAIGEFVAFRTGPVGLVREWFSGYYAAGLGSDAANPSSFGFVGFAGMFFFGAMGQLRRVLILALLPAGAIGMWRLARPIGSRRSRVVALVVYSAIPITANSVAVGRWSGLVLYALSPWIINQLARASRLAPFGAVGDEPGPGVVARPLLQRVVILAVLTAIGTMVVPFTIAIVITMALAMSVGGLLVGQVRGVARMMGAGLGGVVLAAVLLLPWSLEFVRTNWADVAGTSGLTAPDLDISHMLRFATGPTGDTVLAWSFVATAALALLIGKRWRLAWAMRGWTIALVGWALVFANAKGYFVGSLPAPEVLLAPGAAGLALAAAMGMAAFEVDLADYHFGWRQIASVVAGAALLLSIMPMLGASLNGRWDLAEGDYNQYLDHLESPSESFRALWIGDSSVLPGTSWPLVERSGGAGGRSFPASFAALNYETTAGRTADIQNLWPGSSRGATTEIRDALRLAATGETDRLGALLAPMGVQFVIVPRRVAPAPYVTQDESNPAALLALLGSQLDLARVEMPAGLTVYRNVAWGPVTARLPRDQVIPAGGAALADRTISGLAGAPDAVPTRNRFADSSGTMPGPAVVYVGSAASDRWQLVVNGAIQPREDALGWANQYKVDASGQVQLRYQTSKYRYLELLGSTLLWLLAFWYIWRTRVRKEDERDQAEMREGHET